MNPEAVQNLLASTGENGPFELHQLEGGRNNRAFRVQTARNTYFLKAFYPESAKMRHTFLRETGFLRYAGEIGLSRVARLMATDPEHFLLLSEFVPGKKYAGQVTDAAIQTAAAWIRELNRSAALPDLEQAADSCRCNEDHFSGVRKRLQRFFDLDRTELNPLLQYFECELNKLEKISQPECRRQIVSPSDFGFHNVLRSNGQLYFVDFEYAGLDDPAKLICDFFCQPDFLISLAFLPSFVKAAFPDEPNLLERVEVLLGVHRIKWACILMNPLLPDRAKARQYSGEALLNFQVVLSRVKKYYWGDSNES
ncbi:MAG: aminoglycoside phosphotransferase family protein [Lentisphaeria bacterium]|nr:aminoglycoside phosphotransferase family protein [Lentisphaeria bacterium]